MENEPIDIRPKQIQNLRLLRNRLWAELTEVDAEIQRLSMGQQRQDIAVDRFWRRTTDYNQTRIEQAGQQSDTKQLKPPVP